MFLLSLFVWFSLKNPYLTQRGKLTCSVQRSGIHQTKSNETKAKDKWFLFTSFFEVKAVPNGVCGPNTEK